MKIKKYFLVLLILISVLFLSLFISRNPPSQSKYSVVIIDDKLTYAVSIFNNHRTLVTSSDRSGPPDYEYFSNLRFQDGTTVKFKTQDRVIDLNNKNQLLFGKKREGEPLPSHWYVGEPDGSTRELRFPVPEGFRIKAFNDREEFLASDLNGGFLILSSTGERLFEATPTHRGKRFRPLQLTNSRLVLGTVRGFSFPIPAIFDCGDSGLRAYGNPFCWRPARVYFNGINDRGETVGVAEYWSLYRKITNNYGPTISFLFDGKGFHTLDEVMAGEDWEKVAGSVTNPIWKIQKVSDINDEGVILAQAERRDGSYEGYVFLVPNTE